MLECLLIEPEIGHYALVSTTVRCDKWRQVVARDLPRALIRTEFAEPYKFIVCGSRPNTECDKIRSLGRAFRWHVLRGNISGGDLASPCL
jgi:hypothetical protein